MRCVFFLANLIFKSDVDQGKLQPPNYPILAYRRWYSILPNKASQVDTFVKEPRRRQNLLLLVSADDTLKFMLNLHIYGSRFQMKSVIFHSKYLGTSSFFRKAPIFCIFLCLREFFSPLNPLICVYFRAIFKPRDLENLAVLNCLVSIFT